MQTTTKPEPQIPGDPDLRRGDGRGVPRRPLGRRGARLGRSRARRDGAFSGALLLARRRSETVKGLLDRNDERISAIDLRATAITALALIAVILIAFVVQIARGQSGWPYSMLGFVGGVTYVVAVIYLRVRG